NLGFCSFPYLYARKDMIKKGIWLVFLCVVAVSCLDEPDCFLLNNHIMGIAFKKIDTGGADTVAITGVAPFPEIVTRDTVSTTRLFLPLNYFQDETTLFIKDLESTRYLRVGYRAQVQFVSEKCGEKFVLTDLTVLEHSFDSVRLVTNVPTRDGTSVQIEIFQ